MVASSSRFPYSVSCRDAALAYGEQGIPVFPVQGKVPFKGSRGFYDATTDPRIIECWWRRWPEANVAIPTGSRSGWAVLDVDGRHGGFESFKQLRAMLEHRLLDFHHPHPWLARTRISRTGSGVHLIWQHIAGARNTTGYAGLPGLDLRGEGGYIVVPPSLHPNGRRYHWELEIAPAPFPSLLLDLLHHQERLRRLDQSTTRSALQERIATTQREDPEYWLARAVALACVGKRHTYALWLACRLIEHTHLTPQQAERYLCRYVDQVPGGGDDYPLSDALNCLGWAAAHL